MPPTPPEGASPLLDTIGHVLSHLEGCPTCEDGRITRPVLCYGVSNEVNKDRWFVVLVERVVSQKIEVQQEGKDIMITWWDKNDSSRRIIPFRVDSGRWPNFRPHDCPDLVRLFQVDTVDFEYFDRRLWYWVHGSHTSPPRNLLTCGELHYCSLGVTHAPEMPGQAAKRAARDAFSSEENTPMSVKGKEVARDIEDTPSVPRTLKPSMLPELDLSWLTNGTDLDPPFTQDVVDWDALSLGSSSQATSVPSSVHTRSGTPASQFDFLSPTVTDALVSSSSYSHVWSNSPAASSSSSLSPSSYRPEHVSPLPALIPGMSAAAGVRAGNPFEATELAADVPRQGKGYPLTYVVDMAVRFSLVERKENLGMPRHVAFTEVFGHKYSSSTWSDHIRAWTSAHEVEGEVERWIQFGHTHQGKWSLFMNQWRQTRKKARIA
ncbi:hypothetical protein C8Q80DRAFT_1272992 [Daedaleopsis nitida]|nr:hypothetical protein C8Q80DRAFT_1272992 [Daedaleopsis nitida]